MDSWKATGVYNSCSLKSINSAWRSPRETQRALYKNSFPPSSTCLALKIHLKKTGRLLSSLGMYYQVPLLSRALYSRFKGAVHSGDLQADLKDLGSSGTSPVPKNVLCDMSRVLCENLDFVLMTLLTCNEAKENWSKSSVRSVSLLSSSSIIRWWEKPSRSDGTDGNGEDLLIWKSARHIRRMVWISGT